MPHRLRLELMAFIAIAISITALVFAIGGDGAQTGGADAEPGDVAPNASAEGVPDAAREVAIVDFRYEPDPVRVSTGTTVVWSNSDLAPHTVTADDGSWGSEYLEEGDAYLVTFEEPGIYRYFCGLHPPRQTAIAGASGGGRLVLGGGGHGMQGTIIVE